MTKVKLPMLVERSVLQVQSVKSDLSRAFETQNILDNQENRVQPACAIGCASCCYRPVSMSIFEAITIYRHLVREGKWNTVLRGKLEENQKARLAIAPAIWLLSLIPCPLLTEDKKCTGYKERPFVCRLVTAVSDPYFCHPHNLGPDTQLLPYEDTLKSFEKAEFRERRANQLYLSAYPIGQALLLAEKVCTGEITIGQVDQEALKGSDNG